MRHLSEIFITIFLLVFILQAAFAQTGTIKGHIHDDLKNEALSFANLSIEKENIHAVTDLDGNFIIQHLAAGHYNIQIRYVGFPDSTITGIRVAADSVTQLNISYPPRCKYSINKKGICPVCHQKDQVIKIVYGYPSDKGVEAADQGKVMLGGCIISYCDPQWYCKRDKEKF